MPDSAQSSGWKEVSSTRRQSQATLRLPTSVHGDGSRSRSAPGWVDGSNVSPSGRRLSAENRSTARTRTRTPNLSPARSRAGSPKYSPRHWCEALLSGLEDRVRQFLRQGAEVNAPIRVEVLENIGLDFPLDRIKGKQSWTPLEISAAGGWPSIVSLLLRNGASFEQYSSALEASFRYRPKKPMIPKTKNLHKRAHSSPNININHISEETRFQQTDDILRLWHFSVENETKEFVDVHELKHEMPTNVLPDTLMCAWEVERAVEEGQTDDDVWDPDVLRRMVAITGLDGEYEALSVDEYMTREWGAIGIELLDAIVRGLRFSTSNSYLKHDEGNTRLKYIRKTKVSAKEVIVVCKENLPMEEKVLLSEALAWLCGAVRMPSTATTILHCSSSTCQLLRTPLDEIEVKDKALLSAIMERSFPPSSVKLIISLKPLSAFEESKDICWMPLLVKGIISARKARVRPRGFGKGLEASFQLLAQMSSVQITTPVEQGVVFLGYETILVPYAFRKGHGKVDDCLQFHLEHSEPGHIGGINPFATEQPRNYKVLSGIEYDITPQTRCFLGWCKAGQINLGTDSIVKNPNYSSARERSQTLHLQGLTLGAQLVSGGAVQGGPTIGFNYVYVSNILSFTPTSSYIRMVEDTGHVQTAVLVDVATQRSWMVPKLSLLLFMAQCWARERVVKLDSIPFVTPHHDGQSVVSQLLDKGSNVIIEADNNESVCLGKLLLGFNTSLLNTGRVVEKTKVNLSHTPWEGGHIFGFELMDIIDEPCKGASMREVKVKTEQSGWLRLCNLADAIVTCSDLGEVITPLASDTSRKCDACNSLPSNRFHLAAPLSCLKKLTQKARNQANAEMYWKLEGAPFKPCVHDEKSRTTCWDRVDLYQTIVKTPKSNGSAPSSKPDKGEKEKDGVAAVVDDMPAEGVLVFGKRKK